VVLVPLVLFNFYKEYLLYSFSSFYFNKYSFAAKRKLPSPIMNNFSRLDPDIIQTYILPRLDGATLMALSCVSSELRHLTCNNEELWRNICTSMWPCLLHPTVSDIITTFPGGYRSFFSDAFPSIHYYNQSPRSYLPTNKLIHAIDISLHGEPKPLFTKIRVQPMNRFTVYSNGKIFLGDYSSLETEIPVKKERWDWTEYLHENLRLSWVIIDPIQNCAAGLFRSSCKPLSVNQMLTKIEVAYSTMMAGQKWQVKVTCRWKGGGDRLYVRSVVFGIEHMTGELGRQAGINLLNTIQNGERIIFD